MRRTYAYNSIIFGVLLAVGVWAKTQNIPLAIVTLLVVSVVGFVLIRAIENAITKGAEAAEDAIVKAVHKKQAEKNQDKE